MGPDDDAMEETSDDDAACGGGAPGLRESWWKDLEESEPEPPPGPGVELRVSAHAGLIAADAPGSLVVLIKSGFVKDRDLGGAVQA